MANVSQYLSRYKNGTGWRANCGACVSREGVKLYNRAFELWLSAGVVSTSTNQAPIPPLQKGNLGRYTPSGS